MPTKPRYALIARVAHNQRWLTDLYSRWDRNYAVYMSKTDNSPQETQDIRDAISLVAGSTGVAPEFILVCMIQESNGRVRVPTTNNGVPNPGLMQSYGALTHGSCANVLPGHCTGEMITQMIRDGVASNAAGMGLVDLIARSGAQDVSKYYKATRYYNSGVNSMPPNGDLTGASGSTASYSSDIANRLVGWTG